MTELRFVLTICLVFCGLAGTSLAFAEDVAGRRAQVLEATARGAEGIPVLAEALMDENALVRRAAVRGLATIGEPAREALSNALASEDSVLRRAAVVALAPEPTPDALSFIAEALQDEDSSIREFAVRLLLAVSPHSERVAELLQIAERDEAPAVHRPASARLAALDPEAEPFEIEAPDRVLLRNRPDISAARIELALSLPLPTDGWRFRTDTRQQGHREGWFNEDYDDAAWDETVIARAWTAGYVGVGWYRREIELPERPEHVAAELHFEGVDESAWVWVNGVYVGGQDIGASGWNRPFRVDVTEELRWGQSNQITVRAMNTAAAGGIWRPVTLEALTLR